MTSHADFGDGATTVYANGPLVKSETARRFILTWLGSVWLLVLSMIILGGVTRLTESGLSMVDWRPITGWLPPLSEAAWLAEFEKYKAFPEYQKINRGMSLDDFKVIFGFEYAHRVLGRVIGLAYGLPLLVVLWRGWVSSAMRNRLIVLLFLGGSQGVVGWWMVKSGLVDHPDVSQYRLAVHLGLAFVILSAITWVWLTVFKRVNNFEASVLNKATVLYVCVFLQILSGALVAGLGAGFTYNTWPLMDGRLIPEHYWLYAPVWLAPFEHITAVQFNHRIGAYAVLALSAWFVWRAAQTHQDVRWPRLVLLVITAQAVLGIITLVMVVPISLGALHQFGAAIVLVCVVGYWHHLVYGEGTNHSSVSA